jgi:hypothetical protein
VALSANVIVQPPAPNPAPVVTSIQPDSVTAGGAPFNLIVNGRDFTRSSVVEVNGQARPTFFSFSNQLIASVRAQDVADPADLRITVFTPAPGGGRSAGFTLTVRAPLAGNQPFALINQIDMRFCPDVTSYVSVIDGNGNPVRNLATPNLVCREDNNPITCNLTQAAANTPLSVVLVYGVNGLTTQEDQFFIKAAARNFVTSLADGDRVQVVHLEDVARLQQDFTEDKQKVLNVLDLLIPAGPGNALYDAVNFSAVNASRQLNRRQAVVLFTALDNLSGTFGLDQALGVARNLGVPFYTIAVGQGGSNVNLTGFLRQLSRDTQGQFFSESAFLNYNGLFQRLNTVIQSQYAIQHTAPIFNGQNRNLQFSFTIPEGTVSATRVYRPCAP